MSNLTTKAEIIKQPGFLKRFYNLEPRAAGRILALLVSLTAIKIAMLISLRKYLFEIHFRIFRTPVTWINHAWFYLFVLVMAGSIVCLCIRIKANNNAIVALRAANYTILGLGVAFMALIYHVTLPAGLLSANFIIRLKDAACSYWPIICVHKPFLGIWLASYTIFYRLLICRRCGDYALYLTAIYFGLFAMVNFQGFVTFKDELLALDGLGLAFLAGGRSFKDGNDSLWLVLPAVWTLCGWLIFRLVASMVLPGACSYSILLTVSICEVFGLATAVSVIFGFTRVWFMVMPFYIATFWLLPSQHFTAIGNFNKLICLGLELPRYFIDEVLVVFVIGTLAAGWLWFLPKSRLLALDLICILVIGLALIDLRLSQVMGVRLGWDLLTFNDTPKMIWLLARPYLSGLICALAALVLLYVLLVISLTHWLARGSDDRAHSEHRGMNYVGFIFIILALIGLFADDPDKVEGMWPVNMMCNCPLIRKAVTSPMTPDEFVASARKLGLSDALQYPVITTSPARTNLNVVLIFMESSYDEYLSLFNGVPDTEPLLSQYISRMELFPNYFSDFQSSIHARFAAFTSLYPVKDYDAFTRQRVPVRSLFEILHQNGYFCSIFYSSSFDYTGFRDFLHGREIDEMYDADTMPGPRSTKPVSWGLREEETTRAICSEIRKRAGMEAPFFLTYVPAAPHYPYDGIPSPFMKNKMTQRGNYQPLYLNQLRYMDWNIASILDELKKTHLLNNTMVIITDDHGEMLGVDGGPIGHGWAVSTSLANIPLIIMDPGSPSFKVNYTVGSEVDLLPTILDRLGIPIPSDQIYEGHSLYQTTNLLHRSIYLNSFQQYAVIQDHEFIWSSGLNGGKCDYNQNFLCFDITNDVAPTRFIKSQRPPGSIPSVYDFNKFQENFLKNYRFYCDDVYKIRRIYLENASGAAAENEIEH